MGKNSKVIETYNVPIVIGVLKTLIKKYDSKITLEEAKEWLMDRVLVDCFLENDFEEFVLQHKEK